MKLIVIAKSPSPGRSKTRLCPPCTPVQASALAEAALADTLAAVVATSCAEPVLVLDGEPGGWLPDGIPVIAQRGEGLDQRLAAAFEDVGAPAFLVGMDTPQVTPALLSLAIDRLADTETDIVLGGAEDGGWWGIGLTRADPNVFLGVPMSTPTTVHAQRTRLDSLGLTVEELPTLRDVDDFDDAVAVAASSPDTAFARAVGALPFLVEEAPVAHVVALVPARSARGRG